MPAHPDLSDRDLADLVAYIRSVGADGGGNLQNRVARVAASAARAMRARGPRDRILRRLPSARPPKPLGRTDPMAPKLNHTIVAARDRKRSALFLTEVLGLEAPFLLGPFAVVNVGDELSLDFMDESGEIAPQHYAFLVTESEFDAIFARIRERRLDYWADPHRTKRGRVNEWDDGRGVYFEDPGRPSARDPHAPVRKRGNLRRAPASARGGEARARRRVGRGGRGAPRGRRKRAGTRRGPEAGRRRDAGRVTRSDRVTPAGRSSHGRGGRARGSFAATRARSHRARAAPPRSPPRPSRASPSPCRAARPPDAGTG